MSRAPATQDDAQQALRRFEGLDGLEVEPFGGGLINDTFAVQGGRGAWILQRVHPIFAPEVHIDILAVTEHLAKAGLVTPRLLLADDGRPWVDLGAKGVWRVMTRLPGVSFDAPRGPSQIRSAARLLARFHGALVDLDHAFVGTRSGVHDTPAHLRHLERMLVERVDDPMYDAVAPFGRHILDGASRLPALGSLPPRVVHGDPKLNNVLFAGADGEAAEEAVCWIDLDTVGPMPLHLELGDAWRSWCNRAGEDDTEARFDLAIFEASLVGYAEGCTFELGDDEREALVHGVEWITLELSARFAADALARSYFGWDASRFASAGEHNLVRARGQWALHERVVASRRERAEIIARVLGA